MYDFFPKYRTKKRSKNSCFLSRVLSLSQILSEEHSANVMHNNVATIQLSTCEYSSLNSIHSKVFSVLVTGKKMHFHASAPL